MFAFLAAILTAAASVIEKRTLMREHALEFSSVLAMFNMILAIPFFFLIDYSKIAIFPLVCTFFVSMCGAVAFLLVSKSVRHMELSSASPLLVLSPGVTAVLAFLVLGEALSLFQIGGLILLMFGAYVLQLKNHHGLLEPLKVFRRSKYIHYIFIALVLYGVCSVMDRYILGYIGFQIEAYMAFVHVFLAANLFLMLYLFHDGVRGIIHGVKSAGWWIFVVALLTVSYRYFQFEAVKIASAGLVIAIKRSSVLFCVLLGGELFHERNIGRKLLAAGIMLAGLLMVVL